MASINSDHQSDSKTLLLYSSKTPEEAAIFGFRGSDIQDIRPGPGSETAISPDEWGFTSPTSDGICKYCQLMLHPDVPKLVAHQPNLQRLINSTKTCSVCKWLEVSMSRGLKWLVARYQQGDPSLCDENSTTSPITVEITKFPRYTKAIGCVGNRELYYNFGLPMTITTQSRLGELAARRFWIPHDKLDRSKPYERQEILKVWLAECLDHKICRKSLPVTHHAKLPTRIIDLTGSRDLPSGPEHLVIRLRETQEGEVGTYTALSYCWGGDTEPHSKTIQDSLQEQKRGIDIRSLSLTHREAILATLYLGIRYLWIDSLCIIQDSRQDWEIESARMGSVYSNAHVTLAATSSDSSKVGLLLPFQGALCVNVHGETTSIRMETHRTIDASSEPLNTRGWALQEAILSSRIVCFGGEQWLWKCPSRYATEDGLIDGPRSVDNGLIQWADLVNEGPGDDGRNYLRYWYKIVVDYVNRNLTYRSDKWNAIAGLTNMFIKETGYKYLAGLWAEDLANGLMWEATSRGVVRDTDAIPSWSWLSIRGGLKSWVIQSSTKSMIELLEVQQEWEGLLLASPLKVAQLTVKGSMLKVTLGKRSVTQESRHHIIAAAGSEEIFGEAFLDSKLPDDEATITISCLYVLHTPKNNEYFVLLLAPAVDASESRVVSEHVYRRLGIGVLWEESNFYDGQKPGREILAESFSVTAVLI